MENGQKDIQLAIQDNDKVNEVKFVSKEYFSQAMSELKHSLSSKASKTGMGIVIGLLSILISMVFLNARTSNISYISQKDYVNEYVKETTATNSRQDEQLKQLEYRYTEILKTLNSININIGELRKDFSEEKRGH